MNIKDIENMSYRLRLDIINSAYSVGKSGAHLGGCLSSVEILAVLYSTFLNLKRENFEERDRFIMSKGHAALAQYCVLKAIGKITDDEMSMFETNGSFLAAHAKRDLAHGLEFSGGSLSLGISFAVGVAYACKAKNFNNHVYVLMGDGECDEGLVWEALMFAKHYKLNNLTVIIDHNHLQSDGFIENVINTDSLVDKLSAFGFNTIQADGHNIIELITALNNKSIESPNAIVAETIKGKGVSFIENKYNWHHGSLNDRKYAKAIEDINKNR
jgi:transketolase